MLCQDRRGNIRGYNWGPLSREMTNYLKTVCKVDTYIPARENTIIYQDAVRLATGRIAW